MKLEEQLEKVRAELKREYLQVAEYYKRMSKVSDEYSYSVLQSGIDNYLKSAAALREQQNNLKKAIMKNWAERPHNGVPKSPYD